MIAAVELNQVSKIFGVLIQEQKRNPDRFYEFGNSAPVVRPFHSDHKPLVVLESVTFTVGQGEIFAIVGPSGSGKSTILRLLATRILPDKGQIRIFGFDVARLPESVKCQINYFSFEGSFFRNLTPIENLLFLARENRIAGSETYGRICETLEHLGVSLEDQHTPLHLLSQAAQILVSIASSIFYCPRLLLLDEPVLKLDHESQKRVFNVLKHLRNQIDTTIVIATRQIDQSLAVYDSAIFLNGGRVSSVRNQEAFVDENRLEGMDSYAIDPIIA